MPVGIRVGIRYSIATCTEMPISKDASLVTSFSFPPVRGHKHCVLLPEANKIAYQTQSRSQTKMGSRNAVVHTSFDPRSRNFQPTGANQDRWGRRITHRTGMCQSRTTLMVQSATCNELSKIQQFKSHNSSTDKWTNGVHMSLTKHEMLLRI